MHTAQCSKYGTLWYVMVRNGPLWSIMVHYGTLWYIMVHAIRLVIVV